MSSRISVASAKLDDAVEMAAFLLPIPNGAGLRKILEPRQAVTSRAYDDDTGTARFVVSDGDVVKCFSITDITIDQAEMIAAACFANPVWNEAGFREDVEQALGPTFDPSP